MNTLGIALRQGGFGVLSRDLSVVRACGASMAQAVLLVGG